LEGEILAFQFEWQPGSFIYLNKSILEQMIFLYGNHYGKWSNSSPFNPGKNIKMSRKRIKEWLEPQDSRVALAFKDTELVGYAIALQTKIDYGVISWVTQLVVHEKYRNQDVGKELLFSIWSFNDHFAWGLVSANPYAISALEKATR
jgi:hypothetical protein